MNPSQLSAGLTIQQAAATSGWSPRMLRYLEQAGIVVPGRSAGRYRLYGPAQLQRLRTLRELVTAHEVGLTDVGFALRLRTDATLRTAVESWLDSEPHRPDGVPAEDWLRFEQDKHQRLLAAAQTSREPLAVPVPVKEPA